MDNTCLIIANQRTAIFLACGQKDADHVGTMIPEENAGTTSSNMPVTAFDVLARADWEADMDKFDEAQLADLVGSRLAHRAFEILGQLAVKARTGRKDRSGHWRHYRILVTPYWPSAASEAGAWFEKKRIEAAKLKAAEGGSYSRVEAQQILRVTVATLHNWRKANRLLAWKDPAGRYRFPVWQFGSDCVLSGVGSCLEKLAAAPDVSKLRFFLTPVEKMRPIDLLRIGHIRQAIALAEVTPFARESAVAAEKDELPF